MESTHRGIHDATHFREPCEAQAGVEAQAICAQVRYPTHDDETVTNGPPGVW
jgi:hypothetical protein